MIYLIGGASRVGKSTLAQMLLERKKVAYIATDWIISMLMDASPELHVASVRNFTVEEYKSKAVAFYPFLYQFIKHNQFTKPTYTIEGDSFFPEQVISLQKEFSIKTCFLGVSTIESETILKYPTENNWTHGISQEELQQLSNCTVELSEYIKQECIKYEFPYFDLSKNRMYKLEEAYQNLIK